MTTTTPYSTQPTRRRWFQFSLRTFLVAILLVGLGCGWVGLQLQEKRRHEAVANEVVKSGGRVYVWHRPDCPAWKEWLFGSYAVKPVSLDLSNTDATGTLLSQTEGMYICSLALISSKVTDADLTPLQGMTNLQYLNLNKTHVTDVGLTHLKGLTSLRWLYLDNTQVTDSGLTHLKGLTSLNTLNLRKTQITGAGFTPLKELTSLEHLRLGDTQVTDAGLAKLKGLSRIRNIDLFNTHVTDAGVGRLRKTISSCTIDYSPKDMPTDPAPRPRTAKQ